MLKIKKIYEAPSSKDETRIFTVRLWPRGLSKEKTKVDLWLKEIAPVMVCRQTISKTAGSL